MTSESDKDLDAIYAEAVELGSAKLYQNWAQKYDADNAAKGFHLPQIAAGFAARHIENKQAHILDAGCGTGLVGQSLSILGFDNISGCDLSPEMLKQAADLNIYKSLDAYEMGETPLPVQGLEALICIGCMGPGHLPPSVLDHFVAACRPRARILFNTIAATQEKQGFLEAIRNLEQTGKWALLERSQPFRAYYIEEPDLWTNIFVFEIL